MLTGGDFLANDGHCLVGGLWLRVRAVLMVTVSELLESNSNLNLKFTLTPTIALTLIFKPNPQNYTMACAEPFAK